MKLRPRPCIAFVFVCFAIASVSPARAESEAGMAKPPTEKEITDFFVKDQQESAMHDIVRPATKADVIVTDIKIGGKIKKQVGRGEEARDVWAVKANVVTKISLKNGTEQRRELKLEPSEVWFFYRDAFGAWTAKHGSM
jgi:hypothetical protein